MIILCTVAWVKFKIVFVMLLQGYWWKQKCLKLTAVRVKARGQRASSRISRKFSLAKSYCSECGHNILNDRVTWAYPTNTVLATVAFLLLLDTKLLQQALLATHSYLTLHRFTKFLLYNYIPCGNNTPSGKKKNYSNEWMQWEKSHKSVGICLLCYIGFLSQPNRDWP